MVGWPNTEYGHVFGYLIARPGVYYTLLSWNQLEGFKSNLVRTVVSRRHGPLKNNYMCCEGSCQPKSE